LYLEWALETIEAQLINEEVDIVMGWPNGSLQLLVLLRIPVLRTRQQSASAENKGMLNYSVVILHRYNLLMRDTPLNELLSAMDLDKIQDSCTQLIDSDKAAHDRVTAIHFNLLQTFLTLSQFKTRYRLLQAYHMSRFISNSRRYHPSTIDRMTAVDLHETCRGCSWEGLRGPETPVGGHRA
jgi:hypothetical protein